jgi:hypothetical protein
MEDCMGFDLPFARGGLLCALFAGGLVLPALAGTGGAAPSDAGGQAPSKSAAGPGHDPDSAADTLAGRAPAARPPEATGAAIAPLHPKATAALAKPFAGTKIDVATYHYDNLRTGWNAAETELTQASVHSAKFGLLQTLSVDGSVYAEPLLVSDFKMADGSTRDILLVATAHNGVYAFDAQTYAQIWHVSLGTPQSSAHIGCGDVTPEYGIAGTPVIVREKPGKATVYLVALTEPTANVFHTTLHALNLADGADLRTPVEISPSATLSDGSTLNYDQKNQWVRAGLTWANDSVYVAVSSRCDHNAGNISGWMLRYNQKLKLVDSFHTIESPAGYKLAAFWAGGFAPAADADGTLFAVTGNGNFNKGGKDWGESVLHLPAALKKPSDFFTPEAYARLNGADLDFGSGGVMLLPPVEGQSAPPLAVAMGKDAVLYLLDRTALGKTKPGDAGALQATRVAGSGAGVWGGPAYFRSPTGGVVYYQNSGGPMRAYAVATGATPSLTQFATGSTTSGQGGSTPIVSSNGSTAGTGVVWTIRRGNPMTLEAYDAEHLGTPIFSAAAGSWTAGRPFQTPMQANGRVYVPGTGTVTVFGLTP